MIKMDICIVSGVDINKPAGDTIRTINFASELKKQGFDVTLIAQESPGMDIKEELNGITTHTLPTLNTVPIINHLKRTKSLIRKTKEIEKKKENSLLQIETSMLCGYFTFAGFSNYAVDFHGIVFDEIKYWKLPWYIPSKLYQNYSRNLEKRAAKHAYRVITVSNLMKEFIMKEWGVAEEKIEVIPNGYFEAKIKKVENIKETKEIISFIGLLAKWANVDKVINAANALKKEDVSFYIVGNGPDRGRLEQMVKEYDLNNVTFTGFVPIDKAYEIMAKSKILLAPFPKTLALEVACPIKLLEYMALAKPMVIDNVGEIPAMLKENDAAFVSDPLNQNEFIESIRILLDDDKLRKKIGSNAKELAKDFTWEKQGEKLAKMYESLKI